MIQETTPPDDGLFSALEQRVRSIGWKHFAFFVGVPIFLGTWAAFENWWLLETAGLANALLFYGGHALLPWWLTCLVTAIVMRVLAAWRPHQIIVMLLGVSLALFLSIPYGEWLSSVFLEGTTAGTHENSATRELLDGRFERFWSYLLQPTILWVGINLIFDRLLDFPRYRYELAEMPQGKGRAGTAPTGESPETNEPNVSSTPTIVAPRFLEHIEDPPDIDDVHAVSAEQHYIKVHTATQDYMVLYRFSDAVSELGNTVGLRVHRSHWIRKSSIEEIKMDAKKMTVRLHSGLVVPVSQPYQALVRQTAETQTPAGIGSGKS